MERVSDLKVGSSYVWITRNEGITYKRLSAVYDENVKLSADNQTYSPYHLPLSDVHEIWAYACSIATEEFTKADFELDNQVIIRLLSELKEEVRKRG